jgi:hypothetical protein
MWRVLHLHNDILVGSNQAIKAIEDACISHTVRMAFLILESQVLDTMLTSQQFVQQCNEKFLTDRLTKDNLAPNQ